MHLNKENSKHLKHWLALRSDVANVNHNLKTLPHPHRAKLAGAVFCENEYETLSQC